MTLPVAEYWNPLDLLLIVFLCAAIPAYQLRNSLLPEHTRPTRSLAARALRTWIRLGIPLAVLTFDWWIAARPASALGLGLDVSWSGRIGLALAAVFSLGVLLVSLRSSDAANQAAVLARLKDAGL